MAIKDSELVLHNNENNTTTKFKLEPGSYSGRNIVIQPKPGIKLTKERLSMYKDNLSEFLRDTSSGSIIGLGIKNVTIETVTQEDDKIEVKLTDYVCPVLLPLACINYQIATDESFRSVVKDINIHVDDNKINTFKFSTLDLNPGQVYYIKARYGAGTDWSPWSDIRNFNVNRPTLPKPTINPDIRYNYKETIPYDVEISFSITPHEGSNHDSTTWRIYEKRNDQYVEVWSDPKSRTNLTILTLKNMYPQTLKYNHDYYLGVVVHANTNSSYSEESNLIVFNAASVAIRPPSNLSSYPSYINIANPVLGFDHDIYVNINGKEKLLEYSHIEKINWEIELDGIKTKFTSPNNLLTLPPATLLPGKVYKVYAWYYHKYLGESDKAEMTIITADTFKPLRDNLVYPIKTYDGIAYYGDIHTSLLMNETITYTGKFINTRSYIPGEEMSYNNELYICNRRTPTGEYKIEDYFINANSSNASAYYKSGLPTFKWLVERIGLNPYLCTPDILTNNTNIIHNDISGWLKCQNKQGRIIYISKTPLYNGVAVNDLIKAGLYHPKRKTIRIADNLYYVRLLCTKVNIGYDAIDPANKTSGNINFDYGSEIVNFEEDKIITSLLNGKLASFTTTDLDISTTENKELVHVCDELSAFKIDTQAGMAFLGGKFNSPDDRRYSIRLVLEYIEDYNHPLRHMSPRIPGPDITLLPNKTIKNFDPFLDMCYLGEVPVNEFLSSLAINEKAGIHADNATPNRLWHKFYYKGLIYFLSQGLNISNVPIATMKKANVIYATPLYVLQDGSVKPVNGKIVFNNVIFNVCCPSALNHDQQHTIIKNNKNLPHDILNPGTANQDITIAYHGFISDCVYPIYINQVVSEDDPRQIPYSGAVGYKGKYKTPNPDIPRVMNNFGTCDKKDYDSTLLTSQEFLSPDGTTHFVLNGQRDPYIMKKHNGSDPVNVVFCLTVNPIIDYKKLWKK